MTDSILDKQVVLVTGASRGIGAAISDLMGSSGATVIGTATSDDGAQAISDRFAAAGLKGTGMRLDVTDAAQTQAVITRISEEYGSISVLVNNAGITRDNLFMRMKDDEWDDVIATNLTAVYRLCRLVIKPMVKARGGRIINISSVVGIIAGALQGYFGGWFDLVFQRIMEVWQGVPRLYILIILASFVEPSFWWLLLILLLNLHI